MTARGILWCCRIVPRQRSIPSLPLFPDLTRAEALELVKRFPLGTAIRREFRRCRGACCAKKGSRGHGPYWFGWIGSVRRWKYIGREEAYGRLERAWAMLGAELAELEAEEAARQARAAESPSAVKLAELRRTVVKKPIRPSRSSAGVAAIVVRGVAK